MIVINKELGVLIKQAMKQGWNVNPTNKGHYKWVSPSGGFFFTASTPSDRRAFKNIKRDLRRYGFVEIERKPKKERN